MAARIHQIVVGDLDLNDGRLDAQADSFWQALRATGTALWLDTGDMDAADDLYTAEFAALTTNNTLLNAEVQKGIYDELIAESAKLLTELDDETKVIEIAFILNARHGLRLAQRFGGKVSVELHTDLSHDIERTVAYGLRYFLICPEHFIVKVPLTAAGLIATRRLRDYGVPINFTLGFSARQNFLAANLARPNWTNVFLGRLNAYIKDNGLGDGVDVGEKATLASQRAMREVSATRSQPTWQIAASMRAPAMSPTSPASTSSPCP
jgi:transaldolase